MEYDFPVELIFTRKGLATFYPDFSAQYRSFAKLAFHFVAVSASYRSYSVVIFLLHAKVFVVGKILQDEFASRYQASRVAFRAPNTACSGQVGTRRVF